MNKNNQSKNPPDADVFLDITPETCPMTFVRAKLMIEKMTPGTVAEIRLQGTEPLENVPRSIIDMGHEVISLKAETATTPSDGIHRLLIRKR